MREALRLGRHRLAREPTAPARRSRGRWPRRRCRRRVPDLEFAHTVLLVGCEPLDDAPILDLRIRKGVRRNGVKLAIASARPSALDRNAKQIVRCAPGDERGSLAALEAALRDGGGDDAEIGELAAAAARRRRGRRDHVGRADRLGGGGARCCGSPSGSGSPDRDGAGLLEIPAGANGRGLREAGVVPDAGPGYARAGAAQPGAAPARSPAPPRTAS